MPRARTPNLSNFAPLPLSFDFGMQMLVPRSKEDNAGTHTVMPGFACALPYSFDNILYVCLWLLT